MTQKCEWPFANLAQNGALQRWCNLREVEECCCTVCLEILLGILMLNRQNLSLSLLSRDLDFLSELKNIQSRLYIKLLAKAKARKRDCSYGCMIINTISMFWRNIQQDKLDLDQSQAHNCISVYFIRTW